MRKILAFLLVFVLLSSFGCAKKDDSQKDDGSKIALTAGEVRDKVVAATKDITDLKSVTNCSLTADIAVNSDGLSFDMSITSKLTMEYIVAGDPAEGYFKTTTVTNMFGTKDEHVETVYVLDEDGKYMVYSHDSLMDSWEVEADHDDAYKVQMADVKDFSYLRGIAEDDLTLGSETETVDGHDTYVLSATVSGELLEELGVDFDDLDLDTSELILPTTIYADTESFLPVRMIVGGESFAELFKEKLADSMGDAMEDATFNASVEDFVMDFSYDDVQLPALPEEARESVKPAPYDPKQSDGSYIIYDKGVAARIVFAEGWECTAAQPVFVCAFDEGYEHYVTFAVHPAMSRDELMEMFMDLYQCDPEKCTMLSPIGDYEVLMWSDGKYEAQYFAFTPMGDGWLEVYTYTMEAEDMIPILTEVLPMAEECMEPPTADFS